MKRKTTTRPFLITSVLLGLLCFCTFAGASSTSAARLDINNAGGFLSQVVEPTGLEKTDISTASGNLIKNLLRIVGLAFLLLMVYGGYLWMTARGEESQIEKARDTIVAAIIGIAIVVGAYAVTFFVTTRIVQQSSGPGPVDAGAVGDQPLGCCVIDTGATQACRIDTESECNRRADDLRNVDGDDHARTWTPGINAVICQRTCE